MTPVQPPTPDDIPVSVRDVAIGVAIGSMSWLIRYLCSMEKRSLGYIFRRTVIAGLTSVCVGLATKGYFNSEAMWLAASGASGYSSPELVDYAISFLKRKSDMNKE
jgi:hypothetical protein